MGSEGQTSKSLSLFSPTPTPGSTVRASALIVGGLTSSCLKIAELEGVFESCYQVRWDFPDEESQAHRDEEIDSLTTRQPVTDWNLIFMTVKPCLNLLLRSVY